MGVKKVRGSGEGEVGVALWVCGDVMTGYREDRAVWDSRPLCFRALLQRWPSTLSQSLVTTASAGRLSSFRSPPSSAASQGAHTRR
jgi:hypothetical protein